MNSQVDINLCYTITLLNFFEEDYFYRLCSYIKSFNYTFIKLNYNLTVSTNIEKIKLCCNKLNILLIINNNFSKKTYNDNTYSEVNQVSDNIKISDKKYIILNTTLKNYKNLKDKNKYFQIIINDLHTLEWNNIKNYKFTKNVGIQFEYKNINRIYFTNFGIRNIHVVFDTFPNILHEWSNISIKNPVIDLEYNFSKIFKKRKKIFISGVTGQDGSNLAEYLLKNIKNIIIFGSIRSVIIVKHPHLKNIILHKNFIPIILDLCDDSKTISILKNIKPDYIFNCAAQTVVNKDDRFAINTFKINTIAPLIHLEYIRLHNKKCRYLSCGSSEQFGITRYTPQDLLHPSEPINIYGITKSSLHQIIKYYRKNYNLFACHPILYNHEGSKRGIEFITRKITYTIVRIKKALLDNITPKPLEVGNIYSKRDWSSSKDFVKAFWKILNMNKPDDYILSYGKSHTVKDIIDIAFNIVNIKIIWKINKKNPLKTVAYFDNNILVKINKDFYRKYDNSRDFVGNNTTTKKLLNWDIKIKFYDLIKNMIIHDLKLINLKL